MSRRGDAAVDSTSTDLVLRCYAPQMVARAFARASSGLGDRRDTLGWRLGFVDVAQRFLLAVLASQHAGLGLSFGDAYRKLIHKLETPSLGDVSKTLEELAGALDGRVLDPVIQEVVELFVVRSGSGGATRSPFARHLQALIELRNELFHRDGAPLPDEATAARRLHEIEEPLKELCGGLRVLRAMPLLYVDTKQERQDGAVALRMLRFRGLAPESESYVIDDGPVGIPTQVPFLLLGSGDALLLSPFVAAAANRESGIVEARLLYGWDARAGALTYSALDGGGRTALPEDAGALYTKRDDLLTLRPQAMLRKNAIPTELATRIRGKLGEDDLPVIEGYRLEGKLGTGASSTVYVGRELLADRPPGPRVAIKVLHPMVATDPVQRARLAREHRILSDLQHPSIVKVLRFTEAPGPSLVLEYVDGEDLQSAIERRPLGVERAVGIVEQVLSGLAAAHARGVTHRDVKPSNVLVDKAGHVRLIDFGIAAIGDLPRHTRTLDAVGTLGFAAPEQLVRSAEVGPAADIYAVGRLLEFLVTGELHGLDRDADRVPPGLQAVIRKATQHDVAWRFASADDMLSVLAERKQAGWGGAPVQVGDRLNHSYALHVPFGSVDEVFVFGGSELETHRVVGLAVTTRSADSQDWLRAAIRSIPREWQIEFGHPRLLKTADGLLFAVFDGEEPDRVLDFLVDPARYRARGPTVLLVEQAVQRFTGRDDGPGWLRALWTNLQTRPRSASREHQFLSLFEFLELVLTVLLVQDEVLRDTPPSEWVVVRNAMSIAQLAREAWKRLDLTPRLDTAMDALLEIRNEVAHSQRPVTDAEIQECVRTIGALIDVGAEYAQMIEPPYSLEPVITHAPSGHWLLLVRRGANAGYVALDGTQVPFELTQAAASWLATAAANVDTSAVQQERSTRMMAIRDAVREQLASTPWCGELVADASEIYGGEQRTADFLVRSQERRPLVVVTCVLDAHLSTLAATTLDGLWLSALALGAQFAAITDGTRWNWYNCDVDAGLVEMSGAGTLELHDVFCP